MRSALLSCLVISLSTLGGAAWAQSQSPAGGEAVVAIELNKLESQSDSCRAYFVINNRTEIDFGDIQLDVFIFDTKEIIDRRVALSTRRLQPGKTNIRLFDLTDTACESISRLVVNDVLTCVDTKGASVPCDDVLSLSTRAPVAFID